MLGKPQFDQRPTYVAAQEGQLSGRIDLFMIIMRSMKCWCFCLMDRWNEKNSYDGCHGCTAPEYLDEKRKVLVVSIDHHIKKYSRHTGTKRSYTSPCKDCAMDTRRHRWESTMPSFTTKRLSAMSLNHTECNTLWLNAALASALTFAGIENAM